MPFQALGLGTPLIKAIREAGYTEPTPIQSATIPHILAGLDVIGIAQTGTGKTAAFTLPILTKLERPAGALPLRQTQVLILAPTRELAVQINENVRGYGRYMPIKTGTVFGGVGEGPQKQAMRAGVDIIIATPGRLLDLMSQRCGDFSKLQFLVLDEADRMLDMGFLPDIRRVIRALPVKRQTLLFSATFCREIEGVTREFLHEPKMVQIGRRSNPAETVTQLIYEVSHQAKVPLLIHLLQNPAMDTVLIFTRTKHGAEKAAKKLVQAGIRTETLHSNRSQTQRLKALKDFKTGAVRVLVATDIASRGIDVDGISHVVNLDFPEHSEDYVHRIGRTGRAQAVGEAISFVTPEDRGSLKTLERFIGRGIVRKFAEGFNMAAAAAPTRPLPPSPRPHRAEPRFQTLPQQPQPKSDLPIQHKPASIPERETAPMTTVRAAAPLPRPHRVEPKPLAQVQAQSLQPQAKLEQPAPLPRPHRAEPKPQAQVQAQPLQTQPKLGQPAPLAATPVSELKTALPSATQPKQPQARESRELPAKSPSARTPQAALPPRTHPPMPRISTPPMEPKSRPFQQGPKRPFWEQVSKRRSSPPREEEESNSQARPQNRFSETNNSYGEGFRRQRLEQESQSRPASQPRSGFKGRPAYQDRGGYQARPRYQDRQDRQSSQDSQGASDRPAYQARSGSSDRPVYQRRSESSDRPAYQSRSGSSDRPGYQGRSTSQARPAYQDRQGQGGDRGGRRPYGSQRSSSPVRRSGYAPRS